MTGGNGHEDEVRGEVPVLDAERSGPAVTAEDVTISKKKEEEALQDLMDDMVASVKSQGRWFVQLGEKTPIIENRQAVEKKFLRKDRTVDEEETVGYEDSRALILRTVSEVGPDSQREREFTVVTREGIFVAPFWVNEIDPSGSNNKEEQIKKFEALKALIDGEAEPTQEMQFITTDPVGGEIGPHIQLDASRGRGSRIPLSEPSRHDINFGDEDFDSRVKASIKMTESPFKEAVEAAERQTALATDASSAIKNLPPRE